MNKIYKRFIFESSTINNFTPTVIIKAPIKIPESTNRRAKAIGLSLVTKSDHSLVGRGFVYSLRRFATINRMANEFRPFVVRLKWSLTVIGVY